MSASSRSRLRSIAAGMIVDLLAPWRTFLASPNAPKLAMSPLELDGYLTGVVICPQARPIMPSRWLAGLWGGEEPVFEDDEQIKAVLDAVMEHRPPARAGGPPC